MRGQICVGQRQEALESGLELVALAHHRVAIQRLAVQLSVAHGGEGALLAAKKLGKIDLERVVVPLPSALASIQCLDEGSKLGHRARQLVRGVASQRQEAAEPAEALHELIDQRLAIEVGKRPRPVEVAILDQIATSAQEFIPWGAALGTPTAAPQHAAQALTRDGQRALEPIAESVLQQRFSRALVENFELWIDAGVDRTLAQQIGAKPVNGVDVRHLQRRKRALQVGAFSHAARRVASAVELRAQPQFDLTGSLFGEGDRDHAIQAGLSRTDHGRDPRDERSRLAGTRRGFDDQRLAQLTLDALSRVRVDQFGHGSARSLSRGSRRTTSLRSTRSRSYGPQILRKSQYSQVFSAGAAGKKPCSKAPEIVSCTASAAPRAASPSGTSLRANSPREVQ